MIAKNKIEDRTFTDFNRLFSQKTVISIYGASGTGKSTLSMQIIGSFLTHLEPYEDCCVWFQASEAFPKKRLDQMFKKNPRKLEYLTKNIFIIPPGHPCNSYSDQANSINKIVKKSSILPYNLRFIVIDNISHHLRYEIMKAEGFREYSTVVNLFFSDQLLPLIMFCQREDIKLIIIHEVSYNPALDKISPFLDKLYSRIKCLNIFLSKDFRGRESKMTVECEDFTCDFKYELLDTGLKFI
ncbi:MAG: hypothetical protein EU535_06585 [Promethearchaeota archaeon]|nr:MAG: hypothetical protein EU535_06585 [Candidatus Lokiarchaeota archaeon]